MWVAYPVLLALVFGFMLGTLADTDFGRLFASMRSWWLIGRQVARARSVLDFELEAVLAAAGCELVDPVEDYDTSRWLVVVEEFRSDLGGGQ